MLQSATLLATFFCSSDALEGMKRSGMMRAEMSNRRENLEMTIEFRDERELIDGILRSDVSMAMLCTLLLDRFGHTLCRTAANKLHEYDRRKENDRAVARAWRSAGDCHSAADFPEWVRERVADGSGMDTEGAVRYLANGISRNIPLKESFVMSLPDVYFDSDGYRYVIGACLRNRWISASEALRWSEESNMA